MRKKILPLLLFQLMTYATIAQVKYHAVDNLHTIINGTSTLHNWKMESNKGTCDAIFTFTPAGQLSGLTAMKFSMPAESLKSERSAMDKNAYKALKTGKNPDISYLLTSATVTPDGNIQCTGKLTIAGVTQDADLTTTAKVNADKSISIKGTRKISMKSFQMEPPSFMMGTVKTGNDVTVDFNVTLRN